MSETDEIKEWQTQSAKHKVAFVLMMDGVSFRYDEENGITFTAPVEKPGLIDPGKQSALDPRE
ncbi:hypothetical protein [Duncaniella muris]|uniref:hypothetical protein n=1 Tax=Duncaniella muris TaxID=2094150 RepID=UPI0027148E72|nr:hypothetical protein [Duncaniella muris]